MIVGKPHAKAGRRENRRDPKSFRPGLMKAAGT
jgi:hypothetical protein